MFRSKSILTMDKKKLGAMIMSFITMLLGFITAMIYFFTPSKTEPPTSTAITSTSTTTIKEKAVLLLSSRSSSNIPMVIGLNGWSHLKISSHLFLSKGGIDANIDFKYEAKTEVSGSCAATLNNEMFVFGGLNEKRQVNLNKIKTSEFLFINLR